MPRRLRVVGLAGLALSTCLLLGFPLGSYGRDTSAAWFSVGKPLATTPVASGQKAIAFTNGTG